MDTRKKIFSDERGARKFLVKKLLPYLFEGISVFDHASVKGIQVGHPDIMVMHPLFGVSFIELKFSRKKVGASLLHKLSGAQAKFLSELYQAYPGEADTLRGGWVVLFLEGVGECLEAFYFYRVKERKVESILQINEWDQQTWYAHADFVVSSGGEMLKSTLPQVPFFSRQKQQ